MHVNLSEHNSAGTITLTNADDSPIRVEVNTFRWKQETNGSAILNPTNDLVVFPQLLTIPAHGQRQLRLAITKAPSDFEETYKVSITEIGTFSEAMAHATNVAMRIQANIPVFMAPVLDHKSGTITNAGIQKKAITFSIANTGTSHFITKDIRIIGIGADTRQSFSQEIDGTEILAGSKQEYHINLSREQCASLRALTIQASAGNQHLMQTIAAPSTACNA